MTTRKRGRRDSMQSDKPTALSSLYNGYDDSNRRNGVSSLSCHRRPGLGATRAP